MRISLGLVSAAALVIAGGTAFASDYVGPYASIFGGYVMEQNHALRSPTHTSNIHFRSSGGVVGGGAIGYDFGMYRVEGEASYRSSHGIDRRSGKNFGSGRESSLGLMVNAYYDFENSSKFTPYVGAGVGYGITGYHFTSPNTPNRGGDSDGNFAYQGIVGVKYNWLDTVSLFLDYRYFSTLDTSYKINRTSYKSSYHTHNFVAGVTFNFGAPEAAPMPVAAVAPAAAPQLSRSYLVFFDWNSVKITPEAQAIIKDAYNAANKLGVARIQLTGHADRSGSAAYNQVLSVRRAVAVKKVLIGMGFPKSGITTIGKGESDPLVPTPNGVREPQNRRVEIVLE